VLASVPGPIAQLHAADAALHSPLDEMSERPPLEYLRRWMDQSRDDPDWVGQFYRGGG